MSGPAWDDPELYELENADDPHLDLPFWRGLVGRRAPRRVLELGCGTGRLTLRESTSRSGWHGEPPDGGARRYVFVCAEG